MKLKLFSSDLSVHDRAMAGVAFMDKTMPGWRSKIDRGSLNIMYDCGCVIGQVFGSFNDQMRPLFAGDYKKAADLGFYAYAHLKPSGKQEYAALTEAWQKIFSAEDEAKRVLTSKTARASHQQVVAA